MDLSDINVKQRGTVKSDVYENVYENIKIKSEKQDETQKPGETNKDEGLYEQLRIDNNQDKNELQKKDDQPQRLKCVIYILSAMIFVLYIAVIVLIILVVVSRSPVDGAWTSWSEWTACDVTCGNGTQIRIRACANPYPSLRGANCVGEIIQNDRCMKETCRDQATEDVNWANWSEWTACDVTCGNGSQIRTRACANPSHSLKEANCVGESIQNNRCMKDTCPEKDGGWTSWGSWSACSVTCGGGGTKARTRSCTNPKPSDLGEFCKGDPFQLQQCSLSICSDPVDGNWTNWSEWTGCDVTCGNGTQSRTRACANPSPLHGGANCVGESIQNKRCMKDACPGRNGGWTNWGGWSVCSVTCGGGGTHARSRSCTNPKPSDLGKYCDGDPFQLQLCSLTICSDPVDGNWTNWSEWTACDVTCGNGIQTRSRACANPSPSHGGANCVGESIQNNRCIKDTCPVTDGGWTNWGSWSVCSVSCGRGGTNARSRSCTNPKPSDLGEDCNGDQFQFQQCSLSTCSSTDGGWTSWGSWSTCSVTCGGGGTKARGRSCTNPTPSDYARYCYGTTFQFQQCSLSTCSAKMSAFSVDQPSSYGTYGGVSKLTFSHEIYQNGSDFSRSSGTYTCSIPGTYHFSVTLVKKRASSRVDQVFCYLYKNGQQVIYIKVDPTDDATDNGHAAISQSVVIHLNVADTVYLGGCKSPPSTYMESWSSFTGFLLYPDN